MDRKDDAERSGMVAAERREFLKGAVAITIGKMLRICYF